MDTLTILLLVAFPIPLFYLMKMRKELYSMRSSVFEAITSREELKETLRFGIYYRFKRDLEESKEEGPLDFEKFVAKVFEKNYNSSAYVTAGTGDFGIDVEEQREDGLYLGQVKCYDDKNLVGYGPIAVVHSQMIKQDAEGGYVVSTSDFSDHAKEYAKGLKIELIDGKKLTQLWIESMNEHHGDSAEIIKGIHAH